MATMLPLSDQPRTLGDPEVLADRRRYIFEESVEPLNRWVEGLRHSLGPEAEVPWFDPADGGTSASVLWLLDSPGAGSTLSREGSGFISADNNDQTSENVWRTREDAGVSRASVAHWNVLPYHLADSRKIREAAATDVALNGRLVAELLALLPSVRCVILGGEDAARAWTAFGPRGHELEVIVTQYPSAKNLDARPRHRQLIVEAWAQAGDLATAPLHHSTELAVRSLPELSSGTSSMLVQVVGDSEAVVFGTPAEIQELGVVVAEVPAGLVRSVRIAAAGAPALASMAMDASGRLVRLTKESSRMLKANEGVLSKTTGSMLGLVRDPTTKKIVGQLQFDKVATAGALAVNLPNLLGAIAMQQQMAQTEKQLAAVQERLDALVDDRRRELEAGLATNLEILDDIYNRAQRRGEVEDTQWSRLVAIESDVRNLHKRTLSALGRLSDALDPSNSSASRSRLLASAMKDDDLADRFKDLVRAELAVTRWEGLRLWHELQRHPKESELLKGQAVEGITTRYDSLLGIADRLDDHLALDGASQKLMDKLRIVENRRLDRLRDELEEVLRAYRANLGSLGLETNARRTLPAMPALSVGEQLGDLSTAARHVSGSGVEKLRSASSKLPRLRRARDDRAGESNS